MKAAFHLLVGVSPAWRERPSDDGFDHEQAVAAVGVVAREALRDGEAELEVEVLRAGVDRADFEPRDAHAPAAEALFDLEQHAARDAAPPVLGRDAERGDVSGLVWLDDADDEADHRPV